VTRVDWGWAAAVSLVLWPFAFAACLAIRRGGRALTRKTGAPLMHLTNKILKHLGVILVPLPPSAKMLREHANTSESFHPSRGGNTVAWMRRVADLIDPEVQP
jgi:hypothetical protein